MASCHSSEGDEEGEGNTAAATCAEVAPAYCQRRFSCNPESARRFYSNVQACQIDEAASCRVYGGLAGVGPMTGTRWVECRRAQAARPCDDKGPSPEVCAILPGTRAVGEGCVDEYQCATLNCKLPRRMSPSPPPDREYCGTCAAQPAAGDPCVEWYDCGYEDLTCVNDKCLKREDLGGPCESSRTCKDQFICLEGKCGVGPGDGEPCTAGFE